MVPVAGMQPASPKALSSEPNVFSVFHHTGKLVPGTGIAPAHLSVLPSKGSVSTVPPPGQIGPHGVTRTRNPFGGTFSGC